MRKWGRKKSQLALFAVLSSLLVLTSLLCSDNARQIRGTKEELVAEHAAAQPFFPTRPAAAADADASPPKGKRWVVGELNLSTTCASSRNYSGWAGLTPESGRPTKRRAAAECDLFSGRWVYDKDAYPLYDEAGCPYMSDQLACTKHGRPDREYQSWRWQPHGCDLKRWNATEMLERLRGKRLMFVGDSLNRGQWISMVCLLQSVIPAGRRSMSPNAVLTIFRAEDYNATVEFYWAPLLVESNSDDPINHRLEHRIIRPDSLIRHATQWEKADILVFNTYLWWRSGPKVKLLWNFEDRICEDAEGFDALKLALDTWAEWVESRVDTRRKRVFFVTMSPTHLWSWEWNNGSEGNCFQEKTPIDTDGYWGSGSDIVTMNLVQSVLGRLSPKVSVLNITQLSEYRKDGHPSIYRKFWETFSPEQLANPSRYADCIHWCLPGVPDTWNQLLFALL